MSTRSVLAVGLSLAVLLASVGLVGGTNPVPLGDRDGASVGGGGGAVAGDATVAQHEVSDAAAQYKVSLDNVTVRTWLLRNSTVHNATVEQVVVTNATTPNGARANVTLSNVTVGTFVLERGRLLNVTATRLVVRNRSVLDVPGGDLFDPNVEDRTIDRQWTKNATVSGVVIDRLAVDAAYLCGNASLGRKAENASALDPQNSDDKPDIAVQNGTAEEALIIRGHASNWSVESVDQPAVTNASLPQGCSRG